MNFLLAPNTLLFWLSITLCVPLIIIASIFAPWRLVMASQQRHHLLMASVVALSLFWLFGVTVKNAVIFHPLLMTVTTMVLGWSLAQLVGLAALVLLAVFQTAFRSALVGWDMAYSQFHPSAIPLDFCLNVAVPATWAWCVISVVNYGRFKNPFIYILGVGFFGAMGSCLLVDVVALGFCYFAGSQAHWVIIQDHFWLFLLMTFPEGFINGTIATAFTVFLPDLVKTYKESWFVQDKN
ncbi:MAG TPA: hypothetical protein VIZ65_06600 [Cellvibrionaceae bacterium]